MEINQCIENEFEVVSEVSGLRYAVVGIGGGSFAIVARVVGALFGSPISVLLGTDAVEIAQCDAKHKILVGSDIGESLQQLSNLFAGVNLVFLLLHEGRDTESLLASQVANLVSGMGGHCVAVSFAPSCFEHKERQVAAEHGLAMLSQNSTALLVLSSPYGSSRVLEDKESETAFDTSIEMAANFYRAIMSSLSDGYIGVDFNDVTTVLQGPHLRVGYATVPVGASAVSEAFEAACQSPMLNSTEMNNATRALVVIEAPANALKLTDGRDVMRKLVSRAKANAMTICSINNHCRWPDTVSVYVVISTDEECAGGLV